MIQGSNKIFAILLSLALAFLPMQGAFAGILSLDLGDDHASHSMMDMQQKASMTDSEVHSSCTAHNSCDSNDCSSGHCATCVVVTGILGDTSGAVNTSNPTENSVFNNSVSTTFLNSLYRPPRA